ncbi:hypothetical protein [Streptomyces fulvoviolaceus]|uniref:hypothetical protein n=1 Tax=Streptomyces fulvoviolaceus TaxID=285535 RepID=UPI0021C0953C|nr:hypothetical protein [Streptomyces fulvoviolaceus]MCT9080484.1 hypothetical protein [Streptomyces fulvoviolaceus]
MSERYEVDTVNCDLKIIASGVEPGECALEVSSGDYALVIGDSWASGFAVVGSPEDLRACVGRISILVRRGLPDSNVCDGINCRQT